MSLFDSIGKSLGLMALKNPTARKLVVKGGKKMIMSPTGRKVLKAGAEHLIKSKVGIK